MEDRLLKQLLQHEIMNLEKLPSEAGLAYFANVSPLDPPRIMGEEADDAVFMVKLYEHKQKLLVFEKKVAWLAGGLLIRQITVESPIIDCFFTTFADQNIYDGTTTRDLEENHKVLVIVLEDQIRVYDESKSVTIVSFPIHIHNAFPFHRGIVIGKRFEISPPNDTFASLSKPFTLNDPAKSTQGSPFSVQSSTPFSSHLAYSNVPSSAAYTESNFLTLTDPIGDLGTVVSSSTTYFSQKEEIKLYPESTSSSLAATYNSADQMILIYYTRYLTKPKSSNSKSHSTNQLVRKNSKRSISSAGLMNTSTGRTFDDDARHFRATSNPLSYDRMASGTEYVSDTVGSTSGIFSYSSMENWSLRKDVIFTKISSIPFKSDKSFLKIFDLFYSDREAVVIVNTEIHIIDIYIFEKSSNQVVLSKFKDHISLKGLDAAKFDMGKVSSSYIVLLKSNHEIVLFNPFYELLSQPINLTSRCPRILSIDDTNDSEISFLCEDGRHYSFYLQTKIHDQHVLTFINSLKYLSHDLIYENFWLQWCSNISLDLPNCDEWKLYVVTLLSISLPENADFSNVDTGLNEITQLLPYVEKARHLHKQKDSCIFSAAADLSLESLLPKIVLSLHVIREDLKLNILDSRQYEKLSILLSQLVHWMSWSKPWQEYYPVNKKQIDRSLQLSLPEYISKPPNILESLGSLFSGQLISYVTFSIIAGEEDIIDKLVIPRTYNMLRLFEVIVSSEFENLDLIRTMVSFGIDVLEIETYPPGIFFVFKNTIELCQKKLKSNWNVTVEELKLIGRNDLLNLDSVKSQLTVTTQTGNIPAKGIKEILSELSNNEVLSAWDGQAEADKFHVTRLIFSQDRRFYELTKLLQTSKVQTVTFEADSNMDDYDKIICQRAIAAKIALRTLTTPIGRGAVFNSSRKPLVTEGFPIPKMNFSTLVLPDNVNVTLESDVIPQYLLDWGYFHNGASAGLSVSKEFDGISGSWVVFNRPPVLNAQHAGFLLGLGLNGHLKQLEEWHIYNYLGPKHIYTSIGLLIGMAASLKRTMDIKMTKVLSVHVVAFLPPGSTNLNVQLPVQTAGIIGIGLVYLETQHRRMSEVLLAQISSALIINDKKVVNEGYQLAAGFALGYINLGKGDLMLSSHDSHIIDSLLSYGTSIRDIQTLKELDKSCSGAVMALMFMFLKTENQEIAEKLSLPKTIQLLEYVRPDLLMLRSLAKNMVMWNHIEPTKDFVESKIPICISKMYSIESVASLDTSVLPYIHILSGELLSIAICFASTANFDAKKTLLYYLDILLNLSFLEPTNYDSKVALVGIRNARDVILLGLSLIMAGTGDLDIMRRLRYLQGITDEYTKYGNYMATNMSLGFLFLGGGQQAFNTNDNFAIAALLTSIYPMFGSNNYEALGDAEGKSTNELNDLHLQALRHFWALAVENRCLVVREVDSEKPVKVDVNVVLKNKSILKIPSPCLLPDLNFIHKISVNSKNTYFPVEFDLIRSSASANENFKKNLALYVDKRTSYKTLKLDFLEMVDMDENYETKAKPAVGVDSLKSLRIFKGLQTFEKDILFDSIKSNSNICSMNSTVFDFKFEIERIIADNSLLDDDKLMNLKLIFNFVDSFILLNDDKETSRRNKRRNKKFLGGSDNNLDNYFNLDDKEDNFSNNDVSRGLNYLNIEFIEKLKKELFSKQE